ncbi:RNA polymerase III C11 subunit [Myotisia sp. PD_48]|nr:RNA polymerase III C11 subunit [Myotisia sp. PD_48]
MPLTFCPHCSNALTISKAPATSRYPLGVNRFECRTCPYQFELDRAYYERTLMKRKEVSDIMGGKDEWKNADNMATQCPAENCEGDRAYFYQLQIRSADEPMTTFYKNGDSIPWDRPGQRQGLDKRPKRTALLTANSDGLTQD